MPFSVSTTVRYIFSIILLAFFVSLFPFLFFCSLLLCGSCAGTSATANRCSGLPAIVKISYDAVGILAKIHYELIVVIKLLLSVILQLFFYVLEWKGNLFIQFINCGLLLFKSDVVLAFLALNFRL